MTGRTISAGYTGGIVLGATDNPLTVTATGSVGNTDAAALATTGTVDWVIDNAGTIAADGTVAASVGIQMNSDVLNSAGGTITNRATGVISGGQYGIDSAQAVILANAGTITGTSSSTGGGVRIGTGEVANTGGTIIGAQDGVILTGVGVVSNTGLIEGTSRLGVLLPVGGTVTNVGTNASIIGTVRGVYANGVATVSNSGSIRVTGGVSAQAVQLRQGGQLDNQAGGSLTGTYAAVINASLAAGTLSNAGTITGASAGVLTGGTLTVGVSNASSGVIVGGTQGIRLNGGGTVVNEGAVTGRFGVQTRATVGTVTNTGSVQSTGKFTGQNAEQVGAGVQVQAGGTIINEAGGRISGYWIGAQVGSFNGGNPNGGAVLNAGTIFANDPGVSGAAVWFKGNGTISNAATGSIGGGPFGIVTYDTVTIVNRGEINGASFAITTSTEGTNNRIIVYPGATFSGTVLGDKAGAAAPTGVLELRPGGVGAINGFGTQFQSFGRVEVNAGATWLLAGTVSAGQTLALGGPGATLTLDEPAAMAGVISGFNQTNTLELAGVTDVVGTSLEAGNVLTVARSVGPAITLRLDPAESFPPGSFGFAAGGGGTLLSAPCFALGTRIAVPGGEVAVEALAPGMRVLLARGGVGEVVWVGHRRVACASHPRPQEVWPVRVVAGAFARGVPGRDLLLSPDHAVFLGGVLIPVRHLVNGRTVRQEAADAVTYFHVELAAHDILLAEGLACESYLDTGNRASFANGGAAVALHPDFARRQWQAQGCAALVEDGPAVASARTRLLARAGAMGLRRGRDAGLSVRADGVALALAVAGARREVALPAGTRAVAIESRFWVPAQMGEGDDWRRLGVAVGRVLLDGVAVEAPCFGGGWHAAEGAWRWSDGCGWLHTRGARRLSFEMATEGVYWAA
jgi:hypothetical protein